MTTQSWNQWDHDEIIAMIGIEDYYPDDYEEKEEHDFHEFYCSGCMSCLGLSWQDFI